MRTVGATYRRGALSAARGCEQSASTRTRPSRKAVGVVEPNDRSDCHTVVLDAHERGSGALPPWGGRWSGRRHCGQYPLHVDQPIGTHRVDEVMLDDAGLLLSSGNLTAKRRAIERLPRAFMCAYA